MTTQLMELGGELMAKRQAATDFFNSFDAVGDEQAKKMSGEDLIKLKGMNTELEQIQDRYRTLEKASALIAQEDDFTPTANIRLPRGEKLFGDKVADLMLSGKGHGKEYRNFDYEGKIGPLLAKTTMTTVAGFAPESIRDGDVVRAISRPPQLIDIIPTGLTTQAALVYMTESTRTSAAAAKAENTASDEAARQYTQVTQTVETIITSLPVTMQQLEDAPEVRILLNEDLPYEVRQELDRQAMIGDGSTPNLRGLYNANNIQTQARGSDATIDAILKAITLVEVTGRSTPVDFVALHGTAHAVLALTKTSDGQYIFGDPSNAAVSRIWGVPIVRNEALTNTTGLVGCSAYCRLMYRQDIRVDVTDSHASLFTSLGYMMRAYVRAAMKIRRGQAFCRITGIPIA